MKRALLVAVAAVAMALVATPAPAAVVNESTCTEVYGSNTLTYDCGFNVKDYVLGTPVTFSMNFTCTGACGPVLSFGLRNAGFSPSGVAGHMVGGKRLANGLELTFVFDQLKKAGNGYTGNAHFNMNVNMDDGSGTWTAVPCKVDVHLKD